MPYIALPAAVGGPLVSALARFGISTTTLTQGGRFFLQFPESARSIISRIWPFLRNAGLVTGALTILDALPGISVPSPLDLGGGGRPAPAGTIVKSWEANGVPMVRLEDGRMGAWSEKKGMWTYWRPKKPIVIFGSGSADLRTLLRADAAAGRQLKRLKKAIDRRFPRRREQSRRQGPVTIIESGPGGVQKT